MLSEIDINDWDRGAATTKLYDVKRDSIVSLVEEPEIAFVFDHIDGMYSLCVDLQGCVFHPAAWSDVFVWEPKGEAFGDKEPKVKTLANGNKKANK